MSDIPKRLGAIREQLEKIHKQIHDDSNAAGQQDAHLREAVSATSAALAAVQRAQRHAGEVYGKVADGG